jgi:putative holliday junction resolvase
VVYGETVSLPHRCLDETWADGPDDRGSRLRNGVRLGIDVGTARIGVARCDSEGRLASPLTTVHRGRGDLDAIARLTQAEDVVEIIVGLPVGLSGREGAAAAAARAFADSLSRRVAPVPIRLVDERFTTVIAHDSLRRSGSDSRSRRPRVDQAAAALVLQGALDQERSTGRPAGELVGTARGGGG